MSLKKLLKKIIEFLKEIFSGGGDDDPTPPSPDPDPTPTPEPDPDPEPTPQPDPEPEPEPQPTPESIVNPDKVVIWNEQSSANDYQMNGDVIARSGMIKGRIWRLLHGLYDAMPKDISGFVKSVANEGAKGLALDVEGDFNNSNNLWAIKNACDKFGVKLIGAPKVTLNPGGDFPAGNFEKSVKLCQEIFDAVLIWGYGCNGDAYEYHMKNWRDCGFTKQIGVFQDTVRDTNGYMGKYYWRDVATHAKNGGYPFVLFLPNHSSAADLAELRKMFS